MGKQIYWDKNKERKWESICNGKDLNFSEWVEIKMDEELNIRLNKDYISKKISDIDAKIQTDESEKLYWIRQLNKAKEVDLAKTQEVEELETKEPDRDIQIKKKIGEILLYFGKKEELELNLLAERLYEWELNHTSKDFTLILTNFAKDNNLTFAKEFPFLKRYGINKNLELIREVTT